MKSSYKMLVAEFYTNSALKSPEVLSFLHKLSCAEEWIEGVFHSSPIAEGVVH